MSKNRNTFHNYFVSGGGDMYLQFFDLCVRTGTGRNLRLRKRILKHADLFVTDTGSLVNGIIQGACFVICFGSDAKALHALSL